MNIKKLFRATIAALTFMSVFYTYTYVRDTIQLEQDKLIQVRSHNMQLLSETLDREIRDAEVSLRNIEGQFRLFQKQQGKVMSREQLSELMFRSISSFDNQYNCYFALEQENSKRLFNKDAISNDVHKNIRLLGKADYNNSVTRVVDVSHDTVYQSSLDEIWYHIGKKSKNYEITEIYYDETYMKQWMFSVIKGLYKNDQFEGVIGVDILIDSYFSLIEKNTLDLSGGLILVDRQSKKVITKINPDQPFAPLNADARGQFSLQNYPSWLKLTQENTISQEVTGQDSKSYIASSIQLKNFPWTLISFQDSSIIYASITQKVVVIILFSLLVLSLTIVVFTLVFKQINSLIEDLGSAKFSAEAANNTKSEFLANMSHEIRTPMNAILGFSELLLSKESDPQKKRFLQTIDNSGRSLLRLINDILDLSKIEAGKMNLEYTPVDMRKFIDSFRDVFSYQMKERQLEFKSFISPDVPDTLIVDETRLRQVILNLIGNAIKFTERGHVEISFKKDLHVPKSYNLSIQDTGIGIPQNQLEHIFEAFEQQEGQGNKFGGTGLGLTITKKLVCLMNGTITCTSSLGKGSNFEVTLNNIKHGEQQSLNKIDAKNYQFTKASVLVADDIKDNRDLIEAYLADQPFDIVMADNGKTALSSVEKNEFDLILMDMKMPEIDGFEVCHRLKDHLSYKVIPIIGLSASIMQHEEEDLLTYCNSFIKKPVSKGALLKEMSRYLKHEIIHEANDQSAKVPTELSVKETRKIITHFEKNIDQLLQSFKESMSINDAQELINSLTKLNEQLPEEPFIDIIKKLDNELDSYKIEDFSETTEHIPVLLTQLHKQYTSNN
jgi:signal transduction histidine kinase/CheY-like chemotaxis protein